MIIFIPHYEVEMEWMDRVENHLPQGRNIQFHLASFFLRNLYFSIFLRYQAIGRYTKIFFVINVISLDLHIPLLSQRKGGSKAVKNARVPQNRINIHMN